MKNKKGLSRREAIKLGTGSSLALTLGTGTGFRQLAEGTAWQGGDNPSKWQSVIYPGPNKNFIFNASTIFWAQGLSSPPGHTLPWSHFSRPHGPDPRVQKITHNLLQKAIST